MKSSVSKVINPAPRTNWLMRNLGDLVSVLLFAGTVAVIFANNYIPHTWLTGWDNLHPEFDFSINFWRAVNAVWQENQGTGLLGGMAHAAELPHIVILKLMSFILPLSVLRYAWVFLMLFLGPVGTYFLIKYAVLKNTAIEIGKTLAGIAAGVFYLMNTATVQYFYTPFETFVSFYGFLPWLILSALIYLLSPSKKRLLFFFLISVIAAPAFFVQTLFIVYLIFLLVFLSETILRERLAGLKKALMIGLIVFLANSFCLLPVTYFSAIKGTSVSMAKVNYMASPENQLFNDHRGDWKDVILLRGFWFDYTDFNINNNQYYFLLSDWRDWLNRPDVAAAGYALAFIAFFGLILALNKKGNNWHFAGIIFAFFAYIMLASDNPPTGRVFVLISNTIPLFAEAFRAVFTKWSTAFALTMAVGIGVFVNTFTHILYSVNKRLKLLSIVPVLLIITAMVWNYLPSFQGKMIMPSGRISIPDEYFQVFSFFKNEPKESRIATFPLNTFWGWNFYSWGYRGSGLYWYGIEQPILDRAFDAWSSKNETFYQEISSAFYADDPDSLMKIWEKYDVNYLLVDRNIILPKQDNKLLALDKIAEIMQKYQAEEVFRQGNISVYRLPSATHSFVEAPGKVNIAGPTAGVVKKDSIYSLLGNYLTKENTGIYYPLSYLYQEKLPDVTYRDTDGSTWITLPFSSKKGDQLIIPPMHLGEDYSTEGDVHFDGNTLTVKFLSSVKLSTESQVIAKLPDISITSAKTLENAWVVINQNKFQISKNEEKKVTLQLFAGSPVSLYLFDPARKTTYNFSQEFIQSDFPVCWQRPGKDGNFTVQHYDRYSSLTAEDKAGCFSAKIGNFTGVNLVRVLLAYRSHNGSRPHYCVVKEGTFDCFNDEVFYSATPEDNNWMSVERLMVLPPNPYWISVAARPPDTEGTSWSIDYMAPLVESFPMAAHRMIGVDFWDVLTNEQTISLDDNSSIQLVAQKTAIDMIRSGQSDPKDCDVFQRGEVRKNTEGTTVIYKADHQASICDYVPLTKMNTDDGYFLRFIGENVSGRAMKVYLFNQAENRDSLEQILNEGKFDTTFTLPAVNTLPKNNYVMTTEVRSFGGLTDNRLDSVYFYNVPIDWLGEWRIEKNKETSISENINDIVEHKVGTYYYELQTTSAGSGVIVLDQGYDNGWIAFQVDSKLVSFLPFFGKVVPHYEYNSWANAWVVPAGHSDIRIIYWPQYLEYFGFGLIIIGFTVLVFPGVKKQKFTKLLPKRR